MKTVQSSPSRHQQNTDIAPYSAAVDMLPRSSVGIAINSAQNLNTSSTELQEVSTYCDPEMQIPSIAGVLMIMVDC